MVNESFARMHGFTVEEIILKNIKDFETPETSQLTPGRMKKVLAGETLNFEVGHFCKNGQTIPLEVTTNLVSIDGQNSILGFHRDIADRKMYEEEINRKNKELELLNAEKDKFFSVIAHDMRSPFTAFLGFTKMMVEDLHTLRLDQIQKIALTMRKSAVNLYRLLENLLEWSQMKRGITTFKPGSVLLKPLVIECKQSFLDLAQDKKITIKIEIQDDLKVFADKNMLSSIIRNLTSNAAKYSLKGGTVFIGAKKNPGGLVEIYVKDTGIGMNRKMIENLFQINVNTNRKGTENEPSTGLGLIICKDFTEKHGGKIWMESEEGKGSTFHFTMPSK
ncbi:MAG: PAS domain-containing sensor histidine kinase [bacterium]